MPKMEEGYFDEKRGLALEHVEGAANDLSAAKLLIANLGYHRPMSADSAKVHDTFREIVGAVHSARRDYEKARWAVSDLEPAVSFDDWLKKHGHDDLIL